jgi:hypothetical protein
VFSFSGSRAVFKRRSRRDEDGWLALLFSAVRMFVSYRKKAITSKTVESD